MALTEAEELELLELEAAEAGSQSSAPSFDPSKTVTDEEFSKLTPEQKMASIRGEQGVINMGITPINKPDLEEQATRIAESKFGQEHPYISAGLGTALVEGPEAAASMIPLSKAPAIGKAARPLYTGVKTLGKELGETMTESGLKRAPEMLGEPRTRSAIIEFVDAMRGLKDKPAKVLREQFTGDGLVQKYDELGRILDHLRVAKQGAQPKQVVANSTIHELSALKNKFGQAIKEQAPKVGEKMGEMATAIKRNQLVEALGKSRIVKAAGTGLGLATGGTAAYKLFQ